MMDPKALVTRMSVGDDGDGFYQAFRADGAGYLEWLGASFVVTTNSEG